jgi:membrane-bound lytic murein transglycosylase MltF
MCCKRTRCRGKVIQKWDGRRPSIQPMLIPFKIWLTQKRIDDVEQLKKQQKKHAILQMTVSKNQERTNTIKWIEKGILDHPLSDHRKYIIWRILSPYLLNVKKLPKEEAYSVMKEWLDKCDRLEKLNFNPKLKIKDGLRGASKGYFPISMEKLKEESRQLYDLVLDRLVNGK